MKNMLIAALCVMLWSCGDSDNGSPYLPGNDMAKGPDLEYTIPDGIPIAMATHYAHLQDVLSETEFEYFLTQVKAYCEGEMKNTLLYTKLTSKLSEDAVNRIMRPDDVNRSDILPAFNRSHDSRVKARSQHDILGGIPPFEGLPDEAPVATDTQLSRVNAILRPDAYDCVEGYTDVRE